MRPTRLQLAVLLGLPSLLACGGAPSAPTHAVPAADRARDAVALVGGRVVTGPGAAPIEDGVVLIEDGRIAGVGPRASTPVPAGATVLRCAGATVLAGFWNSHVHFIEPAFENAATKSADALDSALDEMLLRWGFVHVVDTGSFLENTAALRRRIDTGEVAGPSILTMGGTFVAVGGQPKYIPFPLPQLGAPEQARRESNAVLDGGADGIKLMTVSVVATPPAPVMPLAVVRAVVETAHARDAFVVAHPTNIDGVRVAIEGGVDVLAHTSPESGAWSAEDIARMRSANVALTPTLKLWRYDVHDPDLSDRFVTVARHQVRDFAAAGGVLLFGTDVGYMRDHDPTQEYRLLVESGLGFDAILAMLTTQPAERWTKGRSHGRVVAGEAGDVVVLDGDPRQDAGAWTRVRYALKRGTIVHASESR